MMALTPKRLFLSLSLCISISLLRPYTFSSCSPLVFKTLLERVNLKLLKLWSFRDISRVCHSFNSRMKFGKIDCNVIFTMRLPYISVPCSFSCLSSLSFAPVCPGCPFRGSLQLLLSLLSHPPPQPPIDHVSPNHSLSSPRSRFFWNDRVDWAANILRSTFCR